jgi:S-adenosylmethionine:tRNA-ribosyltransferase-isomerase (queuine synthetase)
MQHVAIMKKSWRLLPKILKKEKTIESRWYQNKYSPWDRIKKGEIVYFKDASDPVTIQTEVDKVMQFENLNPQKVREILKKYGKEDGLVIKDINKFYYRFKDKNYCILVFLKNQKQIKPFNINKAGFGLMSAWICVEDIKRIKV